MACYYSSCLHLPHLKAKSDETEFTLPDFPEANKFHSSQLSESLRASNGTDPFALYLKKVFTEGMKTNGLIINTVEESLTELEQCTSGRPLTCQFGL